MQNTYNKVVVAISRLMVIGLSVLCVPNISQAVDFPAPTGVVLDQADVLTPEQEADLTLQIQAIEAATTAEVALVTPASLEGLPIEMYGIELAEHLQVGKADTDNGLIIIIAPNDRKWRFEVGYGLEGSLTDTTTKLIGESMAPYLRGSDYHGAFSHSLEAVSGILEGDPTIVSQYSGSMFKVGRSGKPDAEILLLPLILLWGFLFWANKGKDKKKYIYLIIGLIVVFLIFDIFSSIICNLMAFLFSMSFGRRGGGGPIIGGFGGGGFSGGGGSFGGFGGGSFGGGGSSGGW